MNKYLMFLMLLFFISCQDENFETPNYKQQIVVDGWIEQGQPARVFLTLSAPYFSEIDSTALRQLVITRAKVTVSDGSVEEVLTLRKNHDYFPPYIYESSSLFGEIGNHYSLKVEYGGKILTAITQIPEPQLLDSIWFKLAPEVDTSGFIVIRFNDKPNVDNYYRIMTRIGTNTSNYSPIFLPNLDGRLIDGKSVTLTISSENNSKIEYYNLNDTINLKFCTIDLTSFNYWSSIYSEIHNTQNPFASTNSHVKTNIVGGLGGWTGYGVNTYRIVCKMK